jgi:hypothetical protein
LPTVSLNTVFLVALAVAVVALAIVLGITTNKLNKLLSKLKRNPNLAGEPEATDGLPQRDVSGRFAILSTQIAQLARAQAQSLNRIGIVRFNPYGDTGGDLSFALAISNNEGNGIVITGLHTRNNSRFYAKPLINWDTAKTLSPEEADAVQRARTAVQSGA